MPDVTSALLAMYQQILGGGVLAREQSALEGASAQRVIFSGLTISPTGTISVANFTVTGNLNVTNATFLNITVTGNVTVNNLTVNGSASVNTDLTVGGVLYGATVSVSGNIQTQSLTVAGAASVGGLLSVTGFGTHSFYGSGAGALGLGVRNTLAGTTSSAYVSVGNDNNTLLGTLQAFASTYTPLGVGLPSGVALYSTGANGLSLSATNAFVRILTGASVERVRVLATGEVLVNATIPVGGGRFGVVVDQSVNGNAITIQNLNAANGLGYVAFYNSAGGVAGYILQTGATTVSYVTSSDARLKTDLGRATDLSALRAVCIHDFTWKADGVRDRGVFAQEAQPFYPRAVWPGSDETMTEGAPVRPWMTDYSKFVPDLIAGWQEHEARLARLEGHADGE
jgi:Chaperone of endosialidase